MLYRVAVVTGHDDDSEGLARALQGEGVSPEFVTDVPSEGTASGFDAVLVDVASLTDERAEAIVRQIQEQHLAAILLLPADRVQDYDVLPPADDLVLYPFRDGELALRIKQAVARLRGQAGRGAIKAGDLTIDPERYEVSLGGRRIVLTYTEYQLLVLLASNPGRVYSREALLSRIWGYDYFGGTRTVDVHIRRLRSKLEIADRTYIETVWNVGYRFRGPETDA